MKRYILCLLLFPFSGIFAAGPLFHMWVAQQYCKAASITEETQLRDFMIGTQFPDIRYISKLSREQTHPKHVTLDDVDNALTAFKKGVLLHAWVDTFREERIDPEVYDVIQKDAAGKAHTLLKFLEEEKLIGFCKADRAMRYLDTILEEETQLIDRSVVERWHSIVQWTMGVRLSNLLYLQSMRGPAFGLPAQTLATWSYKLPHLKNHLLIKKHLYTQLVDFKRAIQKHHSDRAKKQGAK